jgi:hypothetical protein
MRDWKIRRISILDVESGKTLTQSQFTI